MAKPNVFVLRAEYGKYTEAFQKGNYIGIGWFDEDPISGNWNLSDREFLKEKYKEKNPEYSNQRVGGDVGQVFRFLSIKVGDLVICPCEDRAFLLVGRVKGELYFKADDYSSHYTWRKDVEWFPTPLQRRELSVKFQDSFKTRLSCFRPKRADEIFVELGLSDDDAGKSDSKTARVLNSELIKLIREKFSELDATEFEDLVAYLLISLGFEALQKKGKPGDVGIDFEGVLDVSGIVSVKLQVQVKKRSDSISEKEIREFRGALKKGYQGCFITLSTFATKATVSAGDREKEQIQLIDGKKFIEIFIEQYDKIIEAMHNDEMFELADKLKFEKTLIPS